MTISAIIVAAGRGTRSGGDVPKQYRALLGKPVLHHTILAILASPRINEVIVVIHPEDTDLYSEISSDIQDPRLRPPVTGGDSRSQSVHNGLKVASGTIVAIHDGARPLVLSDDLERVLEIGATTGAAYLGLPLTDAVWRVSNGKTEQPISREDIWRAQTPQVFDRKKLLAAHSSFQGTADDDVAIAVAAGMSVAPVQGSDGNIKITYAQDFALAEQLMEGAMDIRTGNGFDVHKFGPGDHVILCGVKIPHDQGLVGHSDADVAMHAVTDALFGAIAEGDIGQWFPPTDPQWKGAPSEIFLAKAVERVAAKGFRISNIDCTLICERPKIGPYSATMKTRLAEIAKVSPNRVNVKATTSEKLGFTGRQEGIAAQASATVLK